MYYQLSLIALMANVGNNSDVLCVLSNAGRLNESLSAPVVSVLHRFIAHHYSPNSTWLDWFEVSSPCILAVSS